MPGGSTKGRTSTKKVDEEAWRIPARLLAAAPTAAACSIPLCGALATEQTARRVPAGWVRTCVIGSPDPARLWCSGACAHVGIARAEVRATR